MENEKRFLVDVGLSGLVLPIKVISQKNSGGQQTIANISINARIMKEFEAGWIDTFIKIAHSHKGTIGTETLSKNILDYLNALKASSVKIDFDYPFFAEKQTPVSAEKCLVCYQCRYSCKISDIEKIPGISFKISIPVITTYPVQEYNDKTELLAQTSIVELEIEPLKDLFPENLIEIVDRHALSPVYSFLTEKDQKYLIKKLHTDKKTSVVMLDEIKESLASNKNIAWYRLKSFNYGILHSYHTIIGTEKSMWVPYSVQT